MMANDIEIELIGYHQSVVVVIRQTTLAITPSDIDDGYLYWYYRVSHPCLVPPHRDSPGEVLVPVYEAGPSDPNWAQVSTLIHRYTKAHMSIARVYHKWLVCRVYDCCKS